MNKKKWKVGIDLAPAALQSSAPGTAHLVAEQARALFSLDVPWTWVPVFSASENPLKKECAGLLPRSGRFRKYSLHASWETARLWKEAGCHLGFCTAYFTPFRAGPVVANYFDANLFEHVDSWHRRRNFLRHAINRALFNHTVRKARRLFILSNYGRDKMIKHFPGTEPRWDVIPCGLSVPDPERAARPGWADQLMRPFFLFAGTFSENKNQRTLLDAWGILQEEYPDAPMLVLAGPDAGDYVRDVIEPRRRKLPRPEEVVITGFVENSALIWAFNRCLGYIQPSFAEGFGMPVIEAMSCGKPVACSNTSSLPETAGGSALLFDPGSAVQMAHSVAQIWRDEELRHSLSQKGRRRAGEFTWEKNANKVAEAILSELALLDLKQAGEHT